MVGAGFSLRINLLKSCGIFRTLKGAATHFIDPMGLEHEKGLNQEKIKLKEDIKQLETKLGKENIVLESFILSQTPYEKLTEGEIPPDSKNDYIKAHVLFLR